MLFKSEIKKKFDYGMVLHFAFFKLKVLLDKCLKVEVTAECWVKIVVLMNIYGNGQF